MFQKNILAISISLTLLAACTGNTDQPHENTDRQPDSIALVEDNGQGLYQSKCSNCHGNDGTAGIGNAANLQASKLDSVAVTQMISNGKGAMPAFKNVLTEAEIQKMERYVYALRK